MHDSQAFITVKKARIARAGKQVYSAREMSEYGITLNDNREFGVVYRPPEVLIKNKDKFAHAAFVDNHTPVDVTPDNWKDYIIGFVGSQIDVEVVDDEVWITGDVIFYDKKAYEAYENGKVELSASYGGKMGVPENAGKCGYDAVLLDIPSVNHVALCDQARAGRNARVLDSMSIFNDGVGGNSMAKIRSGLLGLLGIGSKTKDENFKFSKVLMDSVAKVGTLKEPELEKEVLSVMTHVTCMGDSEARELLVGTIYDCFKHPVEVLAKKEAVSEKIDELYTKCQDSDAEVINRILDTGDDADKDDDDDKDKDKDKDKKDKGKDKDDKDKKDSSVKDSGKDVSTIVEAAIHKSFASLSDSIDAKIDASIKKALGLDEKDKGKDNDQQTTIVADSTDKEDASWLMKGLFGNR